MTGPVEKLIHGALVGEVLEAYDTLDSLVSSAERLAPEYAARIAKAREILFLVRVDIEEKT